LVSAVVTGSGFIASLDGDGNVSSEELSGGGGVEVEVEPSNWKIEASSSDFVVVLIRVVAGKVIADRVRRSAREVWVSSEGGGRFSVIDVNNNVGSSGWNPCSEVSFSQTAVDPVWSVWKSDVADCNTISGGGRTVVESNLTSGVTGGDGGQDGESAGLVVVRRWDISFDGDVDERTRGDVVGNGIRTRENRDDIRRSFLEESSVSISAREVVARSFGPSESTWNVVSVDVISDIRCAGSISLGEGEGKGSNVSRYPVSVVVLGVVGQSKCCWWENTSNWSSSSG